jgi:hypothetical protein
MLFSHTYPPQLSRVPRRVCVPLFENSALTLFRIMTKEQNKTTSQHPQIALSCRPLSFLNSDYMAVLNIKVHRYGHVLFFATRTRASSRCAC